MPAAIRLSAPSIRSWCASVVSPTSSTRSRSTAVSPSQVPQSFSRRSGSRTTGEPEPRADDLRRLARPGEVARVDRVELLVRQLLGELPRLPPAEVAERPVGVPLQAPVGVPVGLAVANEEERGHD